MLLETSGGLVKIGAAHNLGQLIDAEIFRYEQWELVLSTLLLGVIRAIRPVYARDQGAARAFYQGCLIHGSVNQKAAV